MIGATAAATIPTERETTTAAPLVSTPISQRGSSEPALQLFRRSLRVKHSGENENTPTPPDRSNTDIEGFSSKSRSRLRFIATNNSHRITSQFGLTYHHGHPTDGRTSKKHLNAFLTWLRRNVRGIGYLWIMEFQSRGAVHYHLFLTIDPDRTLQREMAQAWCRITDNTPQQLAFHEHPRNWIPWDMGTGQYLTKYLDKESQKQVPDGYQNFGRFWGNSSCMKPEFLELPLDDLEQLSTVDEDTGEIYGGKETVLRWLGRLAKKQTRGYSRFKERVSRSSYTMLDGSKYYDQIERYFDNLNERKANDASKMRQLRQVYQYG